MKASEITIILDRSGSMSSIREATVRGINEFINKVNEVPGEGYWTLIQFDDHSSAMGAGEPFPLVSFERVKDTDLGNQSLSKFEPRGGTALRDAIGLTLARLEKRWLATPPDRRPAMMVVVMTDGGENQSREFTPDQIREITARCQSTHGWEFVYLGANQDAFAESTSLGLAHNAAKGNIQNYAATPVGTSAVLTSGAACVGNWKLDNNASAELSLSGYHKEEPKAP